MSAPLPSGLPHTPLHPRWYRKRMPIFWWTHKWVHARFILRELTGVFVAAYALVLLAQIRALEQGVAAYAQFQEWLRTPTVLALHAVALLFVLFHSVTWLRLAPRALVIRLAGRRLPDSTIVTANYLAWGACSAAIAWFVLAS
ncbi:MAG: fumarate reductase subunit C [Candidatus Neomarinimicrobiota bacterium]